MLILHIIDPSTPEEALEMLSALMRHAGSETGGAKHQVLAMGHQGICSQAMAAGVPREALHFQRSLGWADPVGWRGLAQSLKGIDPTHVHAWGMRGAVAATACSRFKGPRLLTLADTPNAKRLRLLRAIHRRVPWAITVTSSSIQGALAAGSLGNSPQRLVCIHPGIESEKAAGLSKTGLRKQLGLAPDDGPILLIGGPATRAARRDHALWAAAIVQQVFPRTRVLVRSGSRAGPADSGTGDLVRRFSQTLPESRMTQFAPYEIPWSTLVQAADLLVVTADEPIPTGSILWAMAGGVPVIATALDCITELIRDNQTGFLAPPGKPRAVAARLEEYLNDTALHQPLTDRARAQVSAHFKEAEMAERFAAVYRQMQKDPELKKDLALPPAAMAAVDRLTGMAVTR